MSQFHRIPTIETERLILRAPTRADFEPYAEILLSKRAQYMFAPMDRQQAWNYFANDAASWVIDGFGTWTAADKTTDAPRVFLGYNKPAMFPELELGWMTPVDAEGQGFAFEAAQAAQRWGFDNLSVASFVSYITPENARSIALAKRLGGTHDPDAPRPDGESAEETAVYRHRRAA
ncbi:MAG: GNAT family protein [Pseudomonadota bacterium]